MNRVIGTASLHLGDCLEVLRSMADNSVDSIVTDPPYGLNFMGKKWDYDVPSVEIWAECLRVIKPGGHLLAFAGTRTQHRMACRIEDAGFEIRDMIAWVYGSGFPKSLDVSKAIDKHGPSGQVPFAEFAAHYEARRKASGLTHAQVCAAGGWHGATNHGGTSANWANGYGMPTAEQWAILQPLLGLGDEWAVRVEREQYEREVIGKRAVNRGVAFTSDGPDEIPITAPGSDAARQWQGWGTALKPALEPITMARKPFASTVAANVLEWGTGALNIDGCRVGEEVVEKGRAGRSQCKSNSFGKTLMGSEDQQWQAGRWPANLILSDDPEVVAAFPDSNGSGPARKLNRSAKPEQQGWGMNTTASDVASLRDAGTGSAARFFMQCKGDYNDAWQDLNLPQENANTAEQGSSQQRQAAVSALVLAVSSALPEGLLCSGLSMAPFTSATANELRLIAETATQTIQTIGSKFWRESKPARLSLSLNHASDAEIQRLTDTTTITVSRWKSDGSAEPVTFSITPMSLEVGGKDCAPSMDGKRFIYCAKASKKDRGGGNGHPTVKPTDLMAYLCRLVTPAGGIVLDPFMGSGSTGRAAGVEQFKFVGIEINPDYFEIACRRIDAATAQQGLEFA